MKKSKFVTFLLWFSGVIALAIGSCLLFIPVTFQASAGIVLADDPGLLSEMRGPGGFIFSSGVIMIIGAIRPAFTFTALILCCVLYLSYGISRVLSVVLDGMPGETIVAAMVAELVIGALCLIALFKFRNPDYNKS